jgi:plasmid stabilization system protein ParE
VIAVHLRKAAREEFREALMWYRERSFEVAERFAAEVSRTLEHLERFSSTGASVPGVRDENIRRLPVHNFPYHVVFMRMSDRISVLAIAHDRRRPGYWRG